MDIAYLLSERAKGKTYQSIGEKLNISRQRVHQLITGYKSPSNKDWRSQGREFNRRKVRARDGHKCRTCGKQWLKGMRRFDVHHLGGLCGKKSRAYDRADALHTLITLCHKCHFNHPEHTFAT